MKEDLRLREATERFVARAKRLVGESGIGTPPIDPAYLARLQGVQQIILSPYLHTSGRLMHDGKRLIVVLNGREPQERRNFTCCHEIAHTFEWDGSYERSRGAPASVECVPRSVEEYLCDRAAAEMLMPEKLFRPFAEALEPSIESLSKLSEAFAASISAIILRLGALSCWRVVFIVWKFATRLGSSPKLRVSWSVRPANSRCFVPKHIPADTSSGIYDTFATARRTLREETLRLGSLRGRHFVESARFGGYVLSIVHEPDLAREDRHAG